MTDMMQKEKPKFINDLQLDMLSQIKEKLRYSDKYIEKQERKMVQKAYSNVKRTYKY